MALTKKKIKQINQYMKEDAALGLPEDASEYERGYHSGWHACCNWWLKEISKMKEDLTFDDPVT